MPAEGGYSSFMFGKVVDMLYFPIIHGQFPTWFPIWGGENFEFFSPIFNIADFAISCGVGIMILNNRKFFDDEKKSKEFESQSETTV